MKPSRVPMYLLITAVVLVDLVITTHVRRFPDPGAVVQIGFGLGQLAFVTFWTTLGGGRSWLRFTLVLIATALWAIPFARSTSLNWAQWFGVLNLFNATVAPAALLLRYRGFRLTDSPPLERSNRHRQFSLGSLFGLITMSAVLLGSSQWMTFPWPHAATAMLHCLAFAAVALIVLWACLCRPQIAVALTASSVAIVIAGLLSNSLEMSRFSWHFVGVTAVEAMFLYVASQVMLISGYQLTRSQAVAEQNPEPLGDSIAVPQAVPLVDEIELHQLGIHTEDLDDLFEEPQRRALTRT